MAVRLKDIAEDLGVSVVTVSKVLRNHSDIGPETRARVLKRARELNYRPNQTARALVTGRADEERRAVALTDLHLPLLCQALGPALRLDERSRGAIAALAAFAAGAVAGTTTALLHTAFGINRLLSGILVMTALYSIKIGRAHV